MIIDPLIQQNPKREMKNVFRVWFRSTLSTDVRPAFTKLPTTTPSKNHKIFWVSSLWWNC